MTILDNHSHSAIPAVATIGFFDGVHEGHRFLIDQVKAEAKARAMQSLLVTFGHHPMKTIKPDFRPQLLSTTDEKLSRLAGTGVDAIAVLDFTKEQSQMSARDFMEKVLLNIYNVRALLIGHDHHFGHNREEGFSDYARYGRELGMDVIQAKPFAYSANVLPSSTMIRKALLEGDVETATKVLGYPYEIQGKVVCGFQNGRKMGFPTANLSVDADKLVPASGVYLVKVHGLGYGMLNIGTRPTLQNGDDQSIEVHIFDFDGELYSQDLCVSFLRFIRKERQYASLDMLKQQLKQDAEECRRYI